MLPRGRVRHRRPCSSLQRNGSVWHARAERSRCCKSRSGARRHCACCHAPLPQSHDAGTSLAQPPARPPCNLPPGLRYGGAAPCGARWLPFASIAHPGPTPAFSRVALKTATWPRSNPTPSWAHSCRTTVRRPSPPQHIGPLPLMHQGDNGTALHLHHSGAALAQTREPAGVYASSMKRRPSSSQRPHCLLQRNSAGALAPSPVGHMPMIWNLQQRDRPHGCGPQSRIACHP
mmetsp:Transcript_55693/g.125740  ORF Transcript_55693/g.125740 Transcript_55693/m.125740 type:complete len:232 (-) Transcript_55693:255-950(-)